MTIIGGGGSSQTFESLFDDQKYYNNTVQSLIKQFIKYISKSVSASISSNTYSFGRSFLRLGLRMLQLVDLAHDLPDDPLGISMLCLQPRDPFNEDLTVRLEIRALLLQRRKSRITAAVLRLDLALKIGQILLELRPFLRLLMQKCSNLLHGSSRLCAPCVDHGLYLDPFVVVFLNLLTFAILILHFNLLLIIVLVLHLPIE